MVIAVTFLMVLGTVELQADSFRPRTPGCRPRSAAPRQSLFGLSPEENEMFEVGLEDFAEEEGVGDGVGPRFNFVGGGGCHSQPAIGGTSPRENPLFRVTGAGVHGQRRSVVHPAERAHSRGSLPVQAGWRRDGGVTNLFVITGHPEAAGCNIKQPDLEQEVRNSNIIFRIPRRSSAPG